jgi:hypothetical protein
VPDGSARCSRPAIPLSCLEWGNCMKSRPACPDVTVLRGLAINHAEGETVRRIFGLYRELGCVLRSPSSDALS